MVDPAPKSSVGESAVDRVIAEFLAADQAGRPLDSARVIAAHPELAPQLRSFFDNYELFRRIIPPEAAVTETSKSSLKQTSKLIAADVPEVFGRYRIRQLLGRGGMGAVYLAEDTELHRKVALKVPTTSADDAAEILDRFQREAWAAARVVHPNVCPVHDVGQIDGRPYLTMAYIKGVPLTKFIRGTQLPDVRVTLRTVGKLARALAEAHKQGIVHRDLKPANVMVDQRGEPILMDFGLARLTRDADVRVTQTGVVLGSPAYMSPEHLSGKSEAVGPQADVYSLGVLLYEMLTGQLPFKGNLTQVVAQILQTPPPAPSLLRPDVPELIDQLCQQMMAKSPELRPAGMRKVLEVIADCLKESGAGTSSSAVPVMNAPVVAATVSEAEIDSTRMVSFTAAPATPRTGWHRRTWIGLVVVVLLLIVALGSLMRSGSSPENAIIPPVTEKSPDPETIPPPSIAPTEPIATTQSPKQLIVEPDPPPVSALEAVAQVAMNSPAPIPEVELPPPLPAPDPAYCGEKEGAVRNDNELKMKFCWCPPGRFMMGSPVTEPGRDAWEKQVEVTLTSGFWMGQYEVTQDEWFQLTGVKAIEKAQEVINSDPVTQKLVRSYGINGIWGEGPRHPMKFVSRSDADFFCNRMTKIERAAKRLPEGWEYRLPTEAEWEYACRAGTTTATAFGPRLGTNQAAIPRSYNRIPPQREARLHTKEVGEFRPNPWGLYDMHGNVSEWCQDWFQFHAPGGVDPLVVRPDDERYCLLRGGAISVSDETSPSYNDCRSAARIKMEPTQSALSAAGFRVSIGPLLKERPEIAVPRSKLEREIATQLQVSTGTARLTLKGNNGQQFHFFRSINPAPLPEGNWYVAELQWSGQPIDALLFERLDELAAFSSLKVSGCDLGPKDVDLLAGITGLKELSVTACPLTDAGLARLAHKASLTKLTLDDTKVTGQGLATLRTLPHLETLSLRLVPLGPDGITNVSAILSLIHLELYSLDEALLQQFVLARPHINHLSLIDQQQLSPESVNAFSRCAHLKEIDLRTNGAAPIAMNPGTATALLRFVTGRHGKLKIIGPFTIPDQELALLRAAPGDRVLLGQGVQPTLDNN